MSFGQLGLRVLGTAIDILVIVAFIGLILLLIRLVKAAWPTPMSRRFWLLERFAKKQGFEIDSALRGFFDIFLRKATLAKATKSSSIPQTFLQG